MKKFLTVFFILITYSLALANDNVNSRTSSSIDNQLKTLRDLYKSGVLSGYEYEKEKKKILNN